MRTIKLNQIQAHPLQPPARSQDTTDLQESHLHIGVLRPPIVVQDGADKYTCLAGWRTITAGKAMGLKEMPCIIREDLVDDPDKQAAVFAQSNLHKEVTVLEKAAIIKTMVEDGRDLKHVARVMAISTTEANHLLSLANAPSEIQELVRRGGRGRDGLAWSTFKTELSSLTGKQMVERLQEAGDLSKRALKRARQKVEGNVTERMMESTGSILQVIQAVRRGLAQVTVFLRTATPEAKDEVRVALGPVIELWEEVRGEEV